MDTTNIVYLEDLRDIARQQRDTAAAMRAEAKRMCAEARRMSDRAGGMLITITAACSMLKEERSHIVVWPPAA